MSAKASTPSSKSASRSGAIADALPGLLRLLSVAAFLALAACSGGGRQAPPPPAGGANLAGVDLASLRGNPELCLFALTRSGARLQSVADRPMQGACGITNAVEVENTGATALNRSFVATCPLAATFLVFEEQVLQPAARRRFGQDVAEIEHWGTYACRNRNRAKGGSPSEHARANAIDVAAFRLSDGRWIKVRESWNAGDTEAAFLRDVHRGACGLFQGVIGPDGDRHHRDHFHFDMGRWRFCD